jgi:hypothetical protein
MRPAPLARDGRASRRRSRGDRRPARPQGEPNRLIAARCLLGKP